MQTPSQANFQFISICFVGGCLGGLFNSLFVWIMGASGLNTALGIAITPSLSPQWLYLRVVWAGIWGLLFYLPICKQWNIYNKASLLMLAPILVQLIIVFPLKFNKGLLGLQLGILTPVLVVLANMVWAYTTAWWISNSQRQTAKMVARV
ncbi:MAG: hypothetical protein ACC707_11845 [Thiohalomonadales bacterium]